MAIVPRGYLIKMHDMNEPRSIPLYPSRANSRDWSSSVGRSVSRSCRLAGVRLSGRCGERWSLREGSLPPWGAERLGGIPQLSSGKQFIKMSIIVIDWCICSSTFLDTSHYPSPFIKCFLQNWDYTPLLLLVNVSTLHICEIQRVAFL